MAATSLFGNIINIHAFEDGNGRICFLILAPVLIQMKCCLFPIRGYWDIIEWSRKV